MRGWRRRDLLNRRRVNLDFSDEQKQLRDQVRRFLSEECPPEKVRAVLEGPESYDKALYQGLAEMGVLGAAIPEEYGGVGLSHLELCVVAEELGRALAPVPVSSSIYLAAECLVLAGSEAQKQAWLPKLASGEAVGTLALHEGQGRTTEASIAASVKGGKLSGVKSPVADAAAADFAIVAAKEGGKVSLWLVDLTAKGVEREVLETIDPTREQARLTFKDAPAELVGGKGDGWNIASQLSCGDPDGVRAAGRRRPGTGNGAGLCAGPDGIRPSDWIVPGGETYPGGHVCVGDAGAVELLLRGVGAGVRRGGIAGGSGDGARIGNDGVPALREEQHSGARRHGLHLGV